MEIDGIKIGWLGNAGFLIEGSKIIYIDPYHIKDDLPKADYILLTHSHYDHCSLEDIQKLVKSGTRIVMTADCQSKVMRLNVPIKIEVIAPGEEFTFHDLKVTAFPSYNVDKSFHPKEEGWVGYLVKINELLIYHAGDCDLIPEMQKLTGYKQQGVRLISLLPVGGRFTMTAEEAYEAAKVIKPNLAIPMHYGSIAGTIEDAKEFKELCSDSKIEVKILEKE